MSITTEKMYELYKNGMSLNEISRIVGVHCETVRQRFIKCGLPRRSVSDALVGRKKTKAHRNSMSMSRKGKKTKTGWHHTEKAKSAIAKGHTKKSLLSLEEMYREYETGKTLKEVGVLSGLSFGSVRRRFIKAGLRIRKTSEVNTGRKFASYSKERRANISKARTGGKMPPRTLEHRRNISNALKNPDTQRKRKEAIAKNGNRSPGEWLLFSYMCSLGIPFIPDPQACLRRKDDKTAFPDVFIPDIELVVEYDGHSNHKTIKRDDDKARDKELMKLYGITTIRIGRKEIFTKHALNKIGMEIQARRSFHEPFTPQQSGNSSYLL